MEIDNLDRPLPLLKRDLKIYTGPCAEDGSPTYNLHNPVSGSYYQISWEQALLLELLKPGMTMRQLQKAIEQNSTLKPEAEELWSFFAYADMHRLLEKHYPASLLEKEWQARRSSIVAWLIHHYLYFRIPLLRPDAFLGRTLPLVKLLVSPPAKWFGLTVIVMGIILLLGQIDLFLHTFSQFLNWKGALAYMCVYPITKIIHEFAHAYVAKAQGVHVPTMGIAFMVFHPVAYCDVTDGWKLSERSKRIWITLAGVLSEIVLAGFSTVGWLFTSPGLLKNIFFIIASSNWISSLLVNLNPVMRFDGYYLLCDLWGMDNLQTRAFAWTRWKIRKLLFGLDLPPPEQFSIQRQCGIVLYTIVTWLYRFFLYLGIAIMVYYVTNIKPLALFLFGIEMIVFILRPFYIEFRTLLHLKKALTWNYRLLTTLGVFFLFSFWLIVPLPHSKRVPAIIVANEEVTIYSPSEGGLVTHIAVQKGMEVNRGQPLISCFSPYLNSLMEEYETQIRILEREIALSEFSEEKQELKFNEKSFLSEKQAELAKTIAEREGLLELQRRNDLYAPIDGFIYFWDDALHVDQAVSRQKVIGKIGTLNDKKIVAYVPEQYIAYLSPQDRVSFYSHGFLCRGKIEKIEPVHTQYLSHPQLSTLYKHKAPLEVSIEKGQQLRLVDTYYEIKIDPDEKQIDHFRLGQIGEAKISTTTYSILFKLIQNSLAIFHRESSF